MKYPIIKVNNKEYIAGKPNLSKKDSKSVVGFVEIYLHAKHLSSTMTLLAQKNPRYALDFINFLREKKVISEDSSEGFKLVESYGEFSKRINEAKDYGANVNSFKDLMKAIKALPDTIESITVPEEVSSFNPRKKEFETKKDKNWKKDVEKILKKALKSKEGKKVDQFILASYYGKGGATHPYYVDLRTSDSRELAKGMGKGDYGKLD